MAHLGHVSRAVGLTPQLLFEEAVPDGLLSGPEEEQAKIIRTPVIEKAFSLTALIRGGKI